MNNKNQIEKIMTDDKVNVMSKLNLLEILLKIESLIQEKPENI